VVSKNPIVIHTAQLLDALKPEAQRAVYMVIKELYELQEASLRIQ